MAGKKKYYVVWNGLKTGVFSSWKECEAQIRGVEGALYKSFDTEEEAQRAYSSNPYEYIGNNKSAKSAARKADGLLDVPTDRTDTVLSLPMEVEAEALAVDAACSGNPGMMEYRGIYLRTGQVVFHYGPVYGTNNIGEFLAIVHALALLKKKQSNMTIYSDSRNAIMWVQHKKCKTKLERNARTEALFDMIARAEAWLNSNNYYNRIVKWETGRWGEIPADFGRKS